MRNLWLTVLCLSPSFAAERLTLKQAGELALRQHPRLQVARYQQSAAQEVPLQTRSRLLPQANVSSSAVLAEDSNTRIQAGGLNAPNILSRWAGGVSVSQLITDFGRTRALTTAAERRADAAGAAVDVTRAQLLLRVHRAYYTALGAQALQRVASETVRAREVVANRAAALAANQLRSELDASLASVDLQEARLLESNAANAARAALVDLSAALGLPTPGDFELSEEPLPPAPDSAGPEASTAARPELRQAAAEVAASAAAVKAERALLYPTVTGALATGVTPLHVQRLQGHWNAAGIVVDLPFLNGGLFAARQREAVAREKAAQAASQDVARQLSRDLRLAQLAVTNAYERFALTAKLVEQARKSFELAQARYDLGLSSIVEVSQAQLGLTRAEIAQTTARYDYQAAWSALEYERGRL